MSYDVYFQRFRDGDAGVGGNEAAREVLADHLVRSDGEITDLMVGGHQTHVHGLDRESGFMASHIAGREVWDLLVRAAQAADYVILAPELTCVVSAEQVSHLPVEVLEQGLALVGDGADLLRAIGVPEGDA